MSIDSNHPAPTLWRSLDELEGSPAYRALMACETEFADGASEINNDGPTRRTFMKLLAASMALAGFGTSCTRPPRGKIVPYVRQPEEMIPGRPLHFATAYTFGGYARGIIVESQEGRPTKIEGNPDHPASLGATDAIGQAHILGMYDPDRSQNVTLDGVVTDWTSFINTITRELEAKKASGGQGIRILTPTITSPTLASQLAAFFKQYPNAKWHQHDPIGRANASAGTKLALGGQDLQPVYGFVAAKVVVSFDCNFLQDDPGSLYYARKFIDGRRIRDNQRNQMNRLYVAESAPTITGAMADERLRVAPSRIEKIARAIAADVNSAARQMMSNVDPAAEAWVHRVVADLLAHKGASLILAGESQPPVIHALAHQINSALGNVGTSVQFIDRVEVQPNEPSNSLQQLVADMNADAVDTLIMLGGNPAYTAPSDLGLWKPLKENPLSKVRLRIHLSEYGGSNNETSYLCHWHLPLAHELEAWGDARAFDGTATIMQPLIAPLYQGKSAIELLSLLLGQPDRGGYEILREHWMAVHNNAATFEENWEKWLNDGVVEGSAFAPKAVTIAPLNEQAIPTTQQNNTIEIAIRPDPSVWDGRYANNAWLQELPKPITKLTWDNAVMMSAATAKSLGVPVATNVSDARVEMPLVELHAGAQRVTGAAWIVPGHPDHCVTVHLGYGRSRAGNVGTNIGFNAYALRTSDQLWSADGATITVLNRTQSLACTQNHAMMDQHGRDLLKVLPPPKPAPPTSSDDSNSSDNTGEAKKTISLSLYPEFPYPSSPAEGNKWGMVIDQNSCIGCNACIVACQAENNIPVVGKDQVQRGRIMHWLRLDAYFGGTMDEAQGPFFQPLPCMHCEKAPCEVVCPVGATVHDAEGINNMVYNRCIGTRYCSNNCPYKVRHFNFYEFNEPKPESLKLMMNPNVTVRSRGVMEKCSYCIQRINAARIDAKIHDHAIRDGDVVTACAQACPTQAITFGNLNDSGSNVARLKAQSTNYSLLEELQTEPRTTYLPRYTNREG